MISVEGIKLTRYPDHLDDQVCHYGIKTVHSSWGRGFGSAFTPDVAVLKAMSELNERITIERLGLDSSNGCASHMTFAQASRAASAELLERDAVLSSWFSGRTPKWFKSNELPNYFGCFKKAQVKVKVGALARINGIFVLASVLSFRRTFL